MKYIDQIICASKAVLQHRRYLLSFIFFIPLFAFLFFLIPVVLLPGNDIAFQTKLFGAQDYVVIAALALAESLLLVMLWYSLNHRHTNQGKAVAFSKGATGVVGGTMAGFFGMKLCPMCLAVIFGFIGVGYGALPFFLEYRMWFFGSAIFMVLFSLYLTAKRVNGICEKCVMPQA